MKKRFFEITSISREDLEAKGFDTSEISDKTMRELAESMSKDYLSQLYWESLIASAKKLGIPRKDCILSS